MRRGLKILGWVVGIFLVVTGGAVAYVLNVDLNDWKPEIQDMVRDETGRTLIIAGPIEFDLGSDTYLKATEISLSNADWGSRPKMVEIGSVEVGLKLFSLLGSSPDITQFHVEGVRAIIETGADGKANTDFAPPGESQPADAGPQETHGGGGGDLVLPILRDIRIADVEVVMKDAVAGTENTFTLTELTLGSQSAADPLLLNLDAAFDDLALIMGGQMGSLQSMTDAGTTTPIDFIGNLAGIDVAILGEIQDLAGQDGIDVTVTALGEELADAAKIAGIDVPSLGGFKVDVTVKGSGDALSVNPLKVDIGSNDVIKVLVDGTIDDAIGQEGFNISVNVASDQIGNLSPITQAFAGQDVPPAGPLSVVLTVVGGASDGLAMSGLEARVGDPAIAEAVVTGGIADLLTQSGIDLNVSASSPEVGGLSALSPQPIPALGPLSASANISGDVNGQLSASEIDVKLGGEDVVLVSVVGAVADVMKQSGIALDIVATSTEIGGLSPITQELAGQGVPALGPLDASLTVSGGMDSAVSASGIDVKLGRADLIFLTASGDVADVSRQSGISLSISAVSPELGNLSDVAEAVTGQSIPDIGPMDMTADIAGGMDGVLGLSGLDLSLGKSETVLIEASGGIADLLKASGADLGFKVVSPNLATLSGLVGSPVPPIGPVDVSGSIKGAQGEPISLDPFSAKIGGSDIAGTATLDMSGAVPNVVARFSSTYFDLGDVTKSSEGAESSGGGTSSGGGEASAGDGKVIPADPLPLDGLKAINADIEYAAERFIGAVTELTNLSVKLTLQDGALAVSPLSAGVGAGSLNGSISLDGSQATPPLSIKLNGSAMDLAHLLAGVGMKEKIVGPMDLSIDLAGAGASPRAIAASLDGHAYLSMYGSRILKKAVDEAVGETIAGLLSSDGGWIVVDCAVFDYDIADGLMTTKAGYIASGPVTVVAEDTINLGTEELDMTVTPSGGIISTKLGVTGTFANPSVGPRIGAEDVALGALAIVTGGTSSLLLGAASLVADLPEGHPCKEEVAESQEQVQSQPSQPEESGAAGAVQNIIEGATGSGEGGAAEGVGKAIEEGVGGALKGLFGD